MGNKPITQQRALRNTVGFDLRKLTDADLQRVKAYYYGMISLNDHYIGTILDQLDKSGLAESTIVIFNADHGEMLGDHGLLFKGAYFYEGLVHVPLIVRAPEKFRSGTKIDSLVQEIDVMPTILELVGVAAPAGIQGRSLVPLTAGHSERQDAVYSEFPTMKMIRTERWKLVHYVGASYGELYDLHEDPNELTNLYGDSKAAKAQAEMEHRLSDWLINSQDPLLKPQPVEDS